MKKRLQYVDGETLANTILPPIRFVIHELLPQGLHVLAGAPKVGKSWLSLWICLCVTQGEKLWDFPTQKGSVLYLCLEDSYARIQNRLLDLTDDAPGNLFFSILSEKLHEGLEEQLESFLAEHPDTVLVVIDTLQRVRNPMKDSNPYASDYRDLGVLKQLADRHGIALLLIHHLRKMNDDDPMNMISGTTGISGATDGNFVLRKDKRSTGTATLFCTGRDIPYQVRWSDSRTSITYTTPQGKKCRDNRLHEPKYLKGAMELEFTIRAAILTGRTQRAKFPSAEEPASGESDTEYSGAAHCDSVLSAQRDGADTSEPSQSGAECGTTDRTTESSLESDPLFRDVLSAVHHQPDADRNEQIPAEGGMDGATGWEAERKAFLSSLTEFPASGMESGLRSDSYSGSSLAGDLVHLGRSLEMTRQSTADTPAGHLHTDRKLRKKQREKKKALGQKGEEGITWQPKL